MMNSTSGKRRKKELSSKGKGGLALGYEVLEIRDDGDEGQSRPAIDSDEGADIVQKVRLHYRFIIPLLHIRVLRNWYLLPYLLKP
jgi:hypothetical protein